MKNKIFCLFQADCEGRGAILWEPNSQTELDFVNGLFNLGKYDDSMF